MGDIRDFFWKWKFMLKDLVRRFSEISELCETMVDELEGWIKSPGIELAKFEE